MTAVCCHCKRAFATTHGLGQHQRHVRETLAPAARKRLCPDRRTDEEAREDALRVSRMHVNQKLRKAWR